MAFIQLYAKFQLPKFIIMNVTTVGAINTVVLMNSNAAFLPTLAICSNPHNAVLRSLLINRSQWKSSHMPPSRLGKTCGHFWELCYFLRKNNLFMRIFLKMQVFFNPLNLDQQTRKKTYNSANFVAKLDLFMFFSSQINKVFFEGAPLVNG